MIMNSDDYITLFVPGRLCLLGEHSDWAGLYRTINSNIVPGQAIVTGIEQGIYAKVTKSEKFIVDSELPIYSGQKFECEMDTEKLKKTAAEGGFFSYVAGVASYANEYYKVQGLHITITKMDMPIKSGLSSSAAICVLVARAFNQIYHLHCNTMGEMFMAYYGEQRTPSRCGRLDQACAYGVNPVSMVFDGNEISVKPLKIKKTLYFVISDLNSHKDTVKILADLNKCYPFAETISEEKTQEALGIDNKIYIDKAIECLENGEVEEYGKLMIEYQKNFDLKVAPSCPSELKSPVLHSLLRDQVISQWIYGAKGVGSQGDGTVQFLAKDKVCQQKIIEYLKNEKKMNGFALTINPPKAIKRAIIPVAGFGTRLFPVTKSLKKDFFPVLDRDGILKPVLLILLEQLVEAGIENICLVIGEDEQYIYDSFFTKLTTEHYEKLPLEKRKYEDLIQNLKNKITYVYQKERKGFGHAVYQCRDFTKDEPVLLLLGDMIYHSNQDKNCMEQMIDTYEITNLPVISMHTVPKIDVVHYGIMTGQWENKEENLLKITNIKEKPTVDYAQDFLNVPTKSSDENYYAVFGQYVLTKEVFVELKNNIDNNVTENGEIQLTSALEQVRKQIGLIGYVVDGKSYDIGIPDQYIKTIENFYKK